MINYLKEFLRFFQNQNEFKLIHKKRDGTLESMVATNGGPFAWDKARYPDSKTDFSDGAYGRNQYDLSNAFQQGVVEAGDILNVLAIGHEERLLYRGPGSFMPGEHSFLPEKPYEDMPYNIIIKEIYWWEKVGHWTVEEWKAMRREVFGDPI